MSPGVLYPPIVGESTPWKVSMALMSPACVGSAGGGLVESRVESSRVDPTYLPTSRQDRIISKATGYSRSRHPHWTFVKSRKPL